MESDPYSPPKAELKEIAEPAEVPRKIIRQIRMAWIAGLVSASLTLLVALAALGGSRMFGFSGLELIDVLLMLGLSFGIYKKSRACAVFMMVYFLFSKILIFRFGIQIPGLVVALVFVYLYWQGISGTYAYHRLRKAGEAEAD